MRRQRVGGLDDGDLPVEEEQEMQIPIAYQYATVATVDGHRVARILGIDDVMSVERDEGHYNGVIHFAVLRSCLNEASSLLNRLGRIKRGQSLRISNLAALLQARVLQYGLSRLSLDLSDLHEGLRRNTIIWQLAHDIRARPIIPFQLQPVILGERIVVLFDAIRGTLDRFPKEPAGRHAGPNTAPAPAPAPLVCTDLVRRVDAHIGAIGDLLAMQLDYPDISLAMYNSRVVEQLLEEEEHFRPIRGLDHLKLLLAMPTICPLTEFCVSQLYLGDASDMLQRLRAAQQPPKMYIFANLDRVQSATAVRETFITINQHLQIIANGLEHGLIEWDNIKSLDTVHNKFLLPAMGQGAAFRGAAQEFEAELLNFLDHPEMPQDLTAPGGPQHAGLVPALRPLVNRLLGSVGALWGTSIEYPDKKSPEVLVPKEGTNRPDY